MSKINVDEAIKASLNLIINGQDNSAFSKYDIGYFMTNEYIGECLRKVWFNKDKALTILGSGDHVFNLVSAGVKNIEAVDINELQYFVYNLRRAMIFRLTREEFISANLAMSQDHNLGVVGEILAKLKGDIQPEVYEYYRRILEHCSKLDWYIRNLYRTPNLDEFMKGNNYLIDDKAYVELRNKLREVRINLHFGDILQMPSEEIGDGYDIIMLSNIVDYLSINKYPFTMEDFENFLAKFREILNDDGVLINYICNINFDTAIRGSKIPMDSLRPNLISVSPSSSLLQDGMHLVRRNVK